MIVNRRMANQIYNGSSIMSQVIKAYNYQYLRYLQAHLVQKLSYENKKNESTIDIVKEKK